MGLDMSFEVFGIDPKAITLMYSFDEFCWIETDEPNTWTINVPDVGNPSPTLCQYIGELENGKPHGYGELSIVPKSGSYSTGYKGEWKNGRYNGKGELITVFSSHTYFYEGYFKDGNKYGYGESKHYGETTKGYWSCNKFIGE
ncbi:MAG: hypothetical protein ACK5LY_10055 [Lachnospirales bacterium]